MAQKITHITTSDDSNSTVTVSSRHRSERAAKATGRRSLALVERATAGRTPSIGERVGIYREHTADYAVMPPR